MQARIQSNLNRRGSGKKKGGFKNKKEKFWSNFRQFSRNVYKFSERKGDSNPGTPLDPPVLCGFQQLRYTLSGEPAFPFDRKVHPCL
jgi:hypothetical protein